MVNLKRKMVKYFFFISLYMSLFHMGFAQIDSIHVPWKLEGATERIEAYRKGKVTIQFQTSKGIPLNRKAPVNIELSKHAFHFGTSMTQVWPFYDKNNYDTYRHHIKELFNYITLGFYWSMTHKREGQVKVNQYTIDNMEWGKKHNMTMKGHPLIWHNSLPLWLKKMNNPQKVEAIITSHIQYLLTTYPDITTWDVYNEAPAVFMNHVEESGVTRWVNYKGGIRPAVAYLFYLVQQTAPVNTYINNHYTYKHQGFKELNEYLLENKVGPDAIGIQTHMHKEGDFLTESEMWNFLNEYAPFGNIHLTEVTVPSSPPFRNYRELQDFKQAILKARKSRLPLPYRPSTPAWEQFQADYLTDFFTLAFSHPDVEAVVIWNAGDLNAWRGAAGGILDREHQPKPAYHALKKLIKEGWHTQLSEVTQRNGTLTFSGFYGEYSGSISIEGREYPFNFTHNEEEDFIIIHLP